MSVTISVFPYMHPDEWIHPPENRTILDWLNFFPRLPIELKNLYIIPWYQDRLFFTKWYNYAVLKANEIVGPDNMALKQQLVDSMLPEHWRFTHLRQFACIESNFVREDIARSQENS